MAFRGTKSEERVRDQDTMAPSWRQETYGIRYDGYLYYLGVRIGPGVLAHLAFELGAGSSRSRVSVVNEGKRSHAQEK